MSQSSGGISVIGFIVFLSLLTGISAGLALKNVLAAPAIFFGLITVIVGIATALEEVGEMIAKAIREKK
ncbi:MAG: hypothetical protein AAB495_00820 [Patescibacteria group bacterium]